MRAVSGLLLCLLPSLWGQSGAFSPPAVAPLTVSGKLELHTRRVVSPSAFLSTGVAAGLQQWRDSPDEWGQGAAGYGRRFASAYGTNIARNAIGFALDATLRQDPRYIPSGLRDPKARIRYALLHTLLTRTDGGRTTFAVWRFGGAYGAAFLSNHWRPDSTNGIEHAFGRGSAAIGFDAVSNLFKEFWPDIRKRLRR